MRRSPKHGLFFFSSPYMKGGDNVKEYIGLAACAVVFLIVTLLDFYRDRNAHQEEMLRISMNAEKKTEKWLEHYRR